MVANTTMTVAFAVLLNRPGTRAPAQWSVGVGRPQHGLWKINTMKSKSRSIFR